MNADRRRPPTAGLEIQGNWESAALTASWPTGPDTHYVLGRLRAIVIDRTVDGASGPVLEVAAAEAEHACRLSQLGLETFVLEPSPVMLAQGRARMVEAGVRLEFVRGIAEALPFPDRTFDRVLIESAVDHLAGPDLGLREMTRVLRPDGRLVISAVNYRGLTIRLSRVLYRVARRLGLRSRDTLLFWDSPVPLEHTFEASPAVLRPVCEQYLELDGVFGVSLGWGFPGWATLLGKLPPSWQQAILARLDQVAQRWPSLADYVVSVWRPRPTGPAPAAGEDPPRVGALDPAYQWKRRAEERWWTTWFSPGVAALFRADQRFINARFTGDPARTWIDDLIARGPCEAGAVLGCDEYGSEAAWLGAAPGRRLDVYELTPAVIRRVRAGLRRGAARFVRADLNFARLPPAAYDVVWSSGAFHHLVNLEHVLAEVERALRDDGLFALHDYVGEPRWRFSDERLARANALLRDVPGRFRRSQVEEVPPPPMLSPMCALRSDEILPAARARFEVVHEGLGGALLPLFLLLHLDRIEREDPALLRRLLAAEEDALRDLGPCVAYAVYRKRRRTR